MSLTLVTAPASLPVSLAEIKAAARVEGSDGDDDDALLMGYLRSAVQQIDGRDGGLGLALMTQTWAHKIDRFPDLGRVHEEIRLPLQPVQSITSITYTDLAGAEQTLAASRYQAVGIGGALPKIVPAYGFEWPDTRDQPEAVTVTFVAGFGDDSNDVPEPIRQALALMVANFFDGCDSDVAMQLVQPFVTIKRPGPPPW